jgi:hypothetical protein
MKLTVFTFDKCKYYSNFFSELNFWTKFSFINAKTFIRIDKLIEKLFDFKKCPLILYKNSVCDTIFLNFVIYSQI